MTRRPAQRWVSSLTAACVLLACLNCVCRGMSSGRPQGSRSHACCQKPSVTSLPPKKNAPAHGGECRHCGTSALAATASSPTASSITLVASSPDGFIDAGAFIQPGISAHPSYTAFSQATARLIIPPDTLLSRFCALNL